MISEDSVRVAVVGDLLFTTPYTADRDTRGMEALTPEINAMFSGCDLVMANLESTLPTQECIRTEPRVFGTPQQFKSLRQAHINLISLANNHTFDALEGGFKQTRDTLDALQINSFGAGANLQQAQQCASFNIKGVRIAFIGAVAPSTGMKFFADAQTPGVAQLDTEAVCANIKRLKKNHDHVILSPHWGDERFRFPSPEQIMQGRAFIDAGATAVLGHHPHVMQGIETYHDGIIAYSLGNFLSNPVYWESGDTLTWNRFERSSQIIILKLDKQKMLYFEQIPTLDDGISIRVDHTGRTGKYLKRADKFIQHGITASKYKREAFRVQKILPFKAQLRWNKLKRIRPGHFKKALKLLLQKD
jgi:poly-gamma-glutamate synthesis protein (capsule biosynthesis protein)